MNERKIDPQTLALGKLLLPASTAGMDAITQLLMDPDLQEMHSELAEILGDSARCAQKAVDHILPLPDLE